MTSPNRLARKQLQHIGSAEPRKLPLRTALTLLAVAIGVALCLTANSWE